LRHGPQGPGALVAPTALRGRRSRRACFAGKARAPCSPVMFVEGEPPATRPVPLAGRFKLAVSAPPLRDVAAILSFKRPAFTLPPKLALRLRSSLVPAPAGALRAFTIADVDTAAAPGSGPNAGTGACRQKRGKRRSTFTQEARSSRRPCPDMWGSWRAKVSTPAGLRSSGAERATLSRSTRE
jgi:hypothetical protein